MPRKTTYAVIGGDDRQVHLANALAGQAGSDAVCAMFLESGDTLDQSIERSGRPELILPRCDVAIFPLPLADNDGMIHTPLSAQTVSLSACAAFLTPGAVAVAGKVMPTDIAAFQKKGIDLYDYCAREEFAIQNAIPTAEGAIQFALEKLPVTLFESACLVTGYGRIGRVLARLLRAFGAKVKVAARDSQDLAWIRADGLIPIPLPALGQHLAGTDVIFNTIPDTVLGAEALSVLDPACLIIDLASSPGGVDFAAAERMGVQAIHALGLPGKTAPKSAGKITLDAIFQILDERRGLQCRQP
ncbi:MAG: dipicolinate synthase subunit DpsA [Oscillospiraceae bacterium]|nr:dipicolinate synthase subunit DpsA [Oscillospiraceae bacterium]